MLGILGGCTKESWKDDVLGFLSTFTENSLFGLGGSGRWAASPGSFVLPGLGHPLVTPEEWVSTGGFILHPLQSSLHPPPSRGSPCLGPSKRQGTMRALCLEMCVAHSRALPSSLAVPSPLLPHAQESMSLQSMKVKTILNLRCSHTRNSTCLRGPVSAPRIWAGSWRLTTRQQAARQVVGT